MNPSLNWPQKAQKGPWDPLPRKSPRNPKKRGAGGLQPLWGRGPPMPKSAPLPPDRPRDPGPPARPAARIPAAAGVHSPPTRPAPAAVLSLPPRRASSAQRGMACRGSRPPARAPGRGSSPAASCPFTRVYPHTPIYARMGECAWVCGRARVCAYAYVCNT